MTYTEAQKRATDKYKKTSYKRVPLDMKLSEYEKLKSYCEENNLTINGFIKSCIKEKLGDFSEDR